MTERLSEGAAQSPAFKDYKQLRLMKTRSRAVYILLFLLLTLIVRVLVHGGRALPPRAASPVPIAELAEGTREVAAGNLRYKVQARADDEIACSSIRSTG